VGSNNATGLNDMYIYLESKSDQVTYFERNIPENQRRPFQVSR